MRAPNRKVPAFSLYGEQRAGAGPARLHIEDIQARSRRYRWEIAAHTHQGLHQCVFVLQGPADVQLEGRAQPLASPALVLLPPSSVHAFRFSAETHGFVLTVDAALLVSAGDEVAGGGGLDALLSAPHILPLDADADLAGRLQGLLERLTAEFRRPDAGATPVCGWLARSVLWIVGHELLRRHEAPVGSLRHHRTLSQFRLLIERHFMEHWSVARYARQLGLTPARLNRIVRAQGGRSAFALAPHVRGHAGRPGGARAGLPRSGVLQSLHEAARRTGAARVPPPARAAGPLRARCRHAPA
jgi:AraC family transcriptional activator of pobA